MFITKLNPDILEKARKLAGRIAAPTSRLLTEGGYQIYTRFSVARNALYYGAVLKDDAAGARKLAFPELSFGITSKGDLLNPVTAFSAPLICFVYDMEKGLSDEGYTALYGNIYDQIRITDGLSPQQAQLKVQMRDSFKSFLQKLDKEEVKDQQVTGDTMSARIQVHIAPRTSVNYLTIGVTLLSFKKEYPIKDMYLFLTGFKTRATFALPGKTSVTLDGASFSPPYDQALPLLASLAAFSKKAKTAEVSISCERALPFLDLLRKEKLVINGKVTSISEKKPVAITVNSEGTPEFDPPFRSDKTILSVGKEGIYDLDPENGSVAFRPFESTASRQAYLYFKENGVGHFEYIRDLFSKELLPRIAASVQVGQAKDDSPFRIDLYLTFDDKERLQFRTVYTENGKEKARTELKSNYALSIAGAFLSVLESMSGLENGTLSPEATFAFLSRDLTPLSRLCNLYCDDRLKPGHVTAVSNLRVTVGKVGGYLDMTLDHDLYTAEELSAILAAYQRKKRYFLLKDTTLLLSGDELEEAGHIFRNGAVHLDHAPIYHLFSLDSGKMKIRATKEAHSVLTAIRNFTQTPYEPSPRFKGELKSYQIEGVKYLKTIAANGLGAILADEMGLGKTVETIAYLTLDWQNDLDLVICPKAVTYNWESEIRRFSDLPVRIVDGTRENREKILESVKAAKKEGQILITSYDTFRRDADLYEKISFRNVFLDEAQSIKNAFSQRHQSLSSLKAEHRFALTGTPLENSQTDVWSIFDFLMPGYLNSLREFSENLGDEKNDRRIAGLVKPFILRRLKKDVILDLPEKTESNIMIGMDSTQRAIYLSCLQEIRGTLSATKGIAVLAGLTRLRQICVDPSVVYDNYDEVSSKLSYCRDLIGECRANGHKAIVFSSFKTVLLHLKELLEDDYRIGIITGDTSAKDRLSLAEKFNTTDDLEVMLVSLKAGGVGLNLIGADTVILLDPWWNPSTEDQASGRAHRIGQTQNVSIFRLIAKDSIEEKVQTLQQMKMNLFETIIEGTGGASKLSEEDIAYLLE